MPPSSLPMQVRPLTPEQVWDLLEAVKLTPSPLRNRAILLLLLDIGLGVSELCSITARDAAREPVDVREVGKDIKVRSIYLVHNARWALQTYLRRSWRRAVESEPLFLSGGGTSGGEALRTWGVRKVKLDELPVRRASPPGEEAKERGKTRVRDQGSRRLFIEGRGTDPSLLPLPKSTNDRTSSPAPEVDCSYLS